MNRLLIAVIVAAVAGTVFAIPIMSEHWAAAGTIRKIQFTQTFTSVEDPGIGHSSEQLAMVLGPNNGTIYSGTLTYTASEPVQIVVFHKIDKSDSRGQPVWTIDNNTIYAETVISPGTDGGTLDFAGSALGIHSTNSSQFTATVTIDGWIRGATPAFLQNATTIAPVSTLRLSREEVPVTIQLHEGFYGGRPLYYIMTDSSDGQYAAQLSRQGWHLQVSTILAHTPQNLLNRMYVFTNGVPGTGIEGFQNEVFSSIPSSRNFTPLTLVVHARWVSGMSRQVLNSTKEILAANGTGKIALTNTGTVLNIPQVTWPGGQMASRNGTVLSDGTSYTGGQVIAIDNSTETVTFVAHRGWGPDGRTAYYILTGGTPQGPARLMGLPDMPSLSAFAPYARDLYLFTNGIRGGGAFGYQEGISAAQPGDSSYSPVCKVSLAAWNDGRKATLLENLGDIDFEKSQGLLSVRPGMVYGSNYMLDCPIIEIANKTS